MRFAPPHNPVATLLLSAVVVLSGGLPRAMAAQTWAGEVSLPGEQILAFSVTFDETPGGATVAKIDIPAQGAIGLPLSDVTLSATKMAFSISQAGAVWSLERKDADAATGFLEQSGLKLPVAMRRLSAEEVRDNSPKRPQDPNPPFPYTEREVSYTSEDGTDLAGTLTVPAGAGPHPAVVLATGSGPQDRDESVMGHRPFAVLADALSRKGIAVLRSDDRGVGGSTGSVQDSTLLDFAADARAAVAQLRAFDFIDAKRVGLLGHSEGGVVGPLVAAKDPQLSFLVLLAGPGVDGKELLRVQLGALLRTAGLDEESIADQVRLQQVLLGKLKDGAPNAELQAAALALVTAQAPNTMEVSAESLEAAASAAVAGLNNPWGLSFLGLDPRVALRQTSCPVLALNGSLDRQVLPAQNLPEIERALKEAKNKDVTVTELPGLNHLFQHAVTGAPAEYATIEETLAPEVLELVAEWIRKRTGLSESG